MNIINILESLQNAKPGCIAVFNDGSIMKLSDIHYGLSIEKGGEQMQAVLTFPELVAVTNIRIGDLEEYIDSCS